MPRITNTLSTNQAFVKSQTLTNGPLALTLQNDGNLCLTLRGVFLWGTMTHNRDVCTATMQPDGNLALRNSNGDFIWGSMQSGGNMRGGSNPKLVLQDDGNICIYDQDEAGQCIWASNTAMVPFRGVKFKNDSRGCQTYPLVKSRDGKNTVFDGRVEASLNGFLINSADGDDDYLLMDWTKACYSKDNTWHFLRDEANGAVRLGHVVEWGDDVWLNDVQFFYDERSNNTVHIRKYGGPRDGDAAFDGISTNAWWDEAERNKKLWKGKCRDASVDQPRKP